ncbi:hypothetical protein [Modestobacter roseus]|uniref:divisome protein SepX/GlpR n=1 Tax=Modestobacter roseus TaxID=1181884 RepID=UPI001FB6D196|nr:hypothetical protein [Modestobacter roseus]
MGSGVLLAALVVLWFVVLVPMVVTRGDGSSRTAAPDSGRTLQRRRTVDPVVHAETERVSIDRAQLRSSGELQVDVHAVRRRTLAGLVALALLALVGAVAWRSWMWAPQVLLDVAVVGYLMVTRAAAQRERRAAARRAARAAAHRPVRRPAPRAAATERPSAPAGTTPARSCRSRRRRRSTRACRWRRCTRCAPAASSPPGPPRPPAGSTAPSWASTTTTSASPTSTSTSRAASPTAERPAGAAPVAAPAGAGR